MTGLDALFAQLSREPDFDAPELQAHDATDRLLLETAQDQRAILDGAGALAIIGDRHGALTLGAITVLGARSVRVLQDPLLSERALAANAARLEHTHGIDALASHYENHPLGASLLEGVEFVLVQLPRSLAELDEIAQAIARFAHPEVVVLAGGRIKHMQRSMNEVLGRSFGEVSAGLGSRKSRVLTARLPRSEAQLGEVRYPEWGRDPELNFAIAAYGATFGGPTLDHGSRLLLGQLGAIRTGADPKGGAHPQRIVDLGCGNGVLAVSAALKWPEARVIASDQSAAAVAATRLTAGAAGVADRVDVHRADATEAVADSWADLVLLNPPFHSGSTVHTAVAHRLIRSCARVLAPGGELLLVFNSQLGYRSLVERVIGPTTQLARDRTFTVLSALRR